MTTSWLSRVRGGGLLTWILGFVVFQIGCAEDLTRDVTTTCGNAGDCAQTIDPLNLGSHLGAWQVVDEVGDSSNLCLVFCADGRLFHASAACENDSAPGFNSYLPYQYDGEGLVTSATDVGEVVLQGQLTAYEDNSRAIFKYMYYRVWNVWHLERHSLSSSVCESEDAVSEI